MLYSIHLVINTHVEILVNTYTHRVTANTVTILYCTNCLPVYPYRRALIFHCMCTRPIINDIIQLTIPILTIVRLTLTDVFASSLILRQLYILMRAYP